MAYTVGRFWIEAMREDPAHVFLGMRVNNWTSILVFLAALIYFVRVRGPQERLLVTESGEVKVVTDDSPAPPDGAAAAGPVADGPAPGGSAAEGAAADGPDTGGSVDADSPPAGGS